MNIMPLTGILGAEITHITVLDKETCPFIIKALEQYGVVAIREQNITTKDFIRFAMRLGPININRFFNAHPGHKEIALVVKAAGQKFAIGEEWHSDHSYDQKPARYSLLHAIDIPSHGGDTVFASMHAAFETLSSSMQSFLSKLHAWHSSNHVFGVQQNSETQQDGRVGNSKEANQDACHPVVIKHPLSKKSCLYINRQFTTHIESLSIGESKSLLDFLYHHSTDAALTCRIRYQPKTLVIWDNQAVLHKAINDYGNMRREMHRITIEGIKLNSVDA